jgi:hypothetical protein
MLISTALLLDSIIRNSVCTPAKLPCRRVEVGYEKSVIVYVLRQNCHTARWWRGIMKNDIYNKPDQSDLFFIISQKLQSTNALKNRNKNV